MSDPQFEQAPEDATDTADEAVEVAAEVVEEPECRRA